MPKKCPPGIICIENMTLVFLFIILALIGYIMYNYQNSVFQRARQEMQVNIPPTDVHHHHHQQRQQHNLLGISTRLDPLNDPYSPPLKQNGYYHAPDSGDIRGIPVNIETR